VDNLAIARVLNEIGDLLEIKGENPFKIRAYRNAAETIAHLGEPVGSMSPEERRKVPGIGKDLAARSGELFDTGAIPYHRTLLEEFPPTNLDLLRLQGVGPKTVALLYHGLGVRTLEDLEAAARAGRIRSLKGMGAKKETQIHIANSIFKTYFCSKIYLCLIYLPPNLCQKDILIKLQTKLATH
jgi:DNA polymerase (family 10)